MIDLTAIILTKNEEKNIALCINSIKDIAKRILVIDSYSTDQTVEIAKECGAEIYRHKFENQAKQFIYALENTNIDTKWIMRLDADERIVPECASEIEKLCNKNDETDINGLVLRFEVIFMGKKLRHGGIYPFRKLYVFKKGKAYMEDREMDEHIVLSEGKSIEIKIDNKHEDFKDLTFWINKHNNYSNREANDYFARQSVNTSSEKLNFSAKIKRFIKFHVYYKLPMGLRAKLYYIYRYYFKLGFLDGKEGKIFAVLQAYWYRFLVDAKILERKKNSK